MAPIPCKCCGGASLPFATVDFSRSCVDRPEPVFAPAGEPVPYVRCERCGFLFTCHFDALTAAEMANKIYNADYIKADPEFADSRPRFFAAMLQEWLGPASNGFAALDFGGGRGLLAQLVRAAGFPEFASYDPYFDTTPVPATRFDLVTAFEVVEHTRDPLATFREMLALLRPNGAVLFSTLLQPRRVQPDWWYMAPRNGHVSLHSRHSLARLADAVNCGFVSISAGLHLFHRSPANAATRALVRRHARPILRFASQHGIAAWFDASRQVAGLGMPRAALEPRHVLRAALCQIGVPIAR
ncbi:MAG TPA: class I SAM-dependent methyltransferase [Acetobacteraceae bacterium]|nr:class I SAM-dependent methyltransferase [Acetobacteraceae bacterium]